MTGLLDRVVVPVADDDDAKATARALNGHEFGSILAVHVVEKAGGAPDKASVEQREQVGEQVFTVLRAHLGDEVDFESRILYGTDVADAIFDAAADYGASSIVITPRGGSRWIQLLTGDVALSLVTETDRPVVVLPDEDAQSEDGDPAADGARRTDESADDEAQHTDDDSATDGGADSE